MSLPNACRSLLPTVSRTVPPGYPAATAAMPVPLRPLPVVALADAVRARERVNPAQPAAGIA